MNADSFQLCADTIEPSRLEATLCSPAAGAVVTFAGRVRNHNRGREVLRLEYEGAVALARAQFNELDREVHATFDVDKIRCVHRIGTLEIGDIAVWIGVSAAHRGPAFDACRYLIDELKKRLPIWKKEFYVDGDSGWIDGG